MIIFSLVLRRLFYVICRTLLMAITAENMMIDSSLDVGNAEDGMNWTDAECTTEVGEVGEEVV